METVYIKETKRRFGALDAIRGATLLSMIAYHASWDLVYLYGVSMPFYHTWVGALWQQSICWSFILLSGFCFSLGKHPLRRGLTVFFAGLLVTAVTCIVLPKDRIVFGVLTFLGSAMLFMLPLSYSLRRLGLAGKPVTDGRTKAACRVRRYAAAAAVCFLAFMLLKPVSRGFLGFGMLCLVPLPASLYRNYLTAYLGFPPADFFSTDYFGVLPWFFLFLTGYFLYYVWQSSQSEAKGSVGKEHIDNKEELNKGHVNKEYVNKEYVNKKYVNKEYANKEYADMRYTREPFPVLRFLGRHSLLLYMLHQPIIYLLCILLFGHG